MDCELAANLLGDYLDDELTLELRDEVGRHLLLCQHCAWEVQSIRETLHAFRQGAAAAAPSAGFRDRLLSRLLRDHRAAVGGRPGWLSPTRSLGAPGTPFVLELTSEEEPDATPEDR